MEYFCGFCALRKSKWSKLCQERVNENGKEIPLCELLKIFKTDLIEFALNDCNVNICRECMIRVQQCYEFVKQIQWAQTELNKFLLQPNLVQGYAPELVEQCFEPELVQQCLEPELLDQCFKSKLLEQSTDPKLVDQSEAEMVQQSFQSELVGQRFEPELVEQSFEPELVEQSFEPELLEQSFEPELLEQCFKSDLLDLNTDSEQLEQSSEPKLVEQCSEPKLVEQCTELNLSPDTTTKSCYPPKLSMFRPILPKVVGQKPKGPPYIAPRKSQNTRLYKCVQCPAAFNAYRPFKEHEETHTLENKDMNVCKYCWSLFADINTLQKHLSDTHPDGKYACPPCKKTYKFKGLLLKHVHKIHKRDTLIYYCTLCTSKEVKEFISWTTLQEHYLHEHHLINSNQEEDDLEIEMIEEFLDDFFVTDENSFQFSECWDDIDINLPDMLQLSNDDNEVNTEVTTDLSTALFICPNCTEGCKSHKKLLQHLVHRHSIKVISTCECPYCFKRFKAKSHLMQHLTVSHARIKRHVCQLCDRQFATIDHLKKHVLSQHHNERKHVCQTCSKQFTQLCHLKQHSKIHTSGKTLKCNLCYKLFWKKIDLERHTRNAHFYDNPLFE